MPGRRQAINWTNAGILWIGPSGTNSSEILIEIHTFSFKENAFEMSGNWRPFLSIKGLLCRYLGCFCLMAIAADNDDVAHDDVIKWKHFPRYWPFVGGIHRSPENSSHKGQWRGALDVFFDRRPNKRLSKQSRRRWFDDVSVMRHGNYFHITDPLLL